MLYTTALCTWFSSHRRLLLWHAFLLCFWMALYLEVLFWSPLFDEILLYTHATTLKCMMMMVSSMLFSKRVPPSATLIIMIFSHLFLQTIHTPRSVFFYTYSYHTMHRTWCRQCSFIISFIDNEILYFIWLWKPNRIFRFSVNIFDSVFLML